MYIGIDLGGSHIGAGLVDLNGKILSQVTAPNHGKRSYEEVIKDMVRLCYDVTNKAGMEIDEIKSVGIGCPAPCDSKNGILIHAPNLGFRNVHVRDEFQKHLNIPVYIENDANCAALVEAFFGAAKGSESSVTITLGTGLGGGIIIDEKIVSGFNGTGGEIGHMVIVVDGEQCGCGRKGCWEAYSSAAALMNQAVRSVEKSPDSLMLEMVGGDTTKIDGKIIFDASKEGDKTAKEVISNYIRYLAEGVSNILNIFMPEVFVIGGGVCKQGDYLLKPLEELVREKVIVKEGVPLTKFRTAKFENDAGIIGAAMLGK